MSGLVTCIAFMGNESIIEKIEMLNKRKIWKREYSMFLLHF